MQSLHDVCLDWQISKSLLISLGLLIAFNLSTAQTPETTWYKSLGGAQSDYGRSIVDATDGGYIIAGANTTNEHQTVPNFYSLDCYIAKLTPQGIVQWEKSFGGSANDGAYDVAKTFDGGYILAGNANSADGDLTKNNGSSDAWIIKLDSQANIEWQKTFGGSESDMFQSVKQTIDGGYILAGTTTSNNGDVTGNHGGSDFWIVRLDFMGNLLWQKTIGGSSTETGTELEMLADGGFVVAGVAKSHDGDLDLNRGEGDCWIVRLDSNGTIKWQKTYGGTLNDRAESIKPTTDGGFVFAAVSSSNNGDLTTNNGDIDCWVVKLDISGNIQWQKAFGGSGWDYGNSIRQVGTSYVVAGHSESANGSVLENHGLADCWIFQLDSLGRMQWQKSFGGSKSESANDIIHVADGSFVAVGYGQSADFDVSENNGERDIWVFKLAFDKKVCPKSNAVFTAKNSIPFAKYQWQVDMGEGYKNITNDIHYAGANQDTLIASNIPSEWYGHKYQCVIRVGDNATITTPVTLKFSNAWIGTAGANWEDVANWSCGSVPDENTDVIVTSGTVEINSNVVCRSITIKPTATVKVNAGYSLTVTK